MIFLLFKDRHPGCRYRGKLLQRQQTLGRNWQNRTGGRIVATMEHAYLICSSVLSSIRFGASDGHFIVLCATDANFTNHSSFADEERRRESVRIGKHSLRDSFVRYRFACLSPLPHSLFRSPPLSLSLSLHPSLTPSLLNSTLAHIPLSPSSLYC